MNNNVDQKSVSSFGDEWSRFRQDNLNALEYDELFNKYFQIFPFEQIGPSSTGFDMGCGSGRWAKKIAPLVGNLICIDASSEALLVAQDNLQNCKNIKYIHATANGVSVPSESQDFGYSLGVLHHVPDTESALNSCVRLLKPGAPFLLYLYYKFDNKSFLYSFIWRCSEFLRFFISKMPKLIKNLTTDVIAFLIYFPLARLSKLLSMCGIPVNQMPLNFYMNLSIYTMRTDSRDRFGTALEKRFSKKEIARMMLNSGLERVKFSESAPFWCAIGYRK